MVDIADALPNEPQTHAAAHEIPLSVAHQRVTENKITEQQGSLKRVVWYFEERWCGNLKMGVWYFIDCDVVLLIGLFRTLISRYFEKGY